MTPNSKGEILPTAPRWAKNKENLRMGGDVRTVKLYAFRDYSEGLWQERVAILRDGSVIRVPRRGEDCRRLPHVVDCRIWRGYSRGDKEELVVEFTFDTDVVAIVSGFGKSGWCTMDVVEGDGQVRVRYYPRPHVLYAYYDPETGETIKARVMEC